MKITDKRATFHREFFGDLECGATFIDDDEGAICIKVHDSENRMGYFAIALQTGFSFYPSNDDVFTPIETELIIHRTL